MNINYKIHIQANGSRGRIIILILLFLIAIFSFATSGITGFTIIYGAIPVLLSIAYIVFNFKMFAFWMLFIINYFIMFLTRHYSMPIPASLPNEIIEILLLALAIIEVKEIKIKKIYNVMFLSLFVWCIFCCLEVLNNTCNLDINIGNWYAGARLMAFQLLYAFLVCSIYISKPQYVRKFLFMWALCSLFAIFWVWKQKYIGFTRTELAWLLSPYGRSHNLSSGIRYFSCFTDAANFGCHMGAAAITFFIISLTTKIRKDRIFFFIVAVASLWAMFTSGTRTALFCFLIGGILYVFLSRSYRIATTISVSGLLFVFFLAFTNIGQGNQMIRRMRSAFNRNDASANVRDINKAAIKKYIQDAPWGLGLGMNYDKVPANNKYKKVAGIPPDSEYVYIWVHTGVIGITIFVITTVVILLGACWITVFRIKSTSLRGIGAGFCSAFIAIHLGGYGNQILMQFPNVLIFYGGIAITYCLPLIESEWALYEEKILLSQKKRNKSKEDVSSV